MALVSLDTGLVGMAISTVRGRNPRLDEDRQAFRAWYASRSETSHEFAIADIVRFEVSRELLRIGDGAKLRRLDALVAATFPVTVTPTSWNRAARFWADVRRRGLPTAGDDTLDGDAILAAVAELYSEAGEPVVIATTNVKHLIRFGVDARDWRDTPD